MGAESASECLRHLKAGITSRLKEKSALPYKATSAAAGETE